MSDPSLTDTERDGGPAVDDILNALPMDAWGHIISCGYDDNDERCDCSTLRARLESIVAARVVEAVDRERAAWATKIEALADVWSVPESHRTNAWVRERDAADRVRGLLGADDTEGKP